MIFKCIIPLLVFPYNMKLHQSPVLAQFSVTEVFFYDFVPFIFFSNFHYKFLMLELFLRNMELCVYRLLFNSASLNCLKVSLLSCSFLYNYLYCKFLFLMITFRGALVAQWIRPRTLRREVTGSNLAVAGHGALGQGTLSSLPSPSERTESHWSLGSSLISSLLS